MMIKSQRVFRFRCTGTYEIGGRNSVAKLARPFSPSTNESGGLAVATFRISSNAGAKPAGFTAGGLSVR
jgi:hypothetical protein